MAIKTKRKGTRWEHVVRDEYSRQGFDVIRAAASRTPDLVAIKKSGEDTSTVFYIECKTSKKLFTKQEREALINKAKRVGAFPYLVFPKYGPSSTKKDNMIPESLLV